ncbi:hypothetical protein CJF42_20420 [Pseudoalteromonas sp. NBT06-2]|uniref:hypothetical protein n=1 Tax=Pseudoalteromonas sp. NBT06-2 TaxID=2025950 RepID=UPI000BA551A8|nr:hypothetical protein [Pseudoalteromonas sp. NBT06-2]PAJ72588.1 hypothetical protein CJF42_20420 [Pseudoalteromonas sp. NBT06-2]
MKKRLSIYKTFTVILLPIAVIYQLLWSQIFTHILTEHWTLDKQNLLTQIKFASEFIIYSLMLFVLIKFTHKPNKYMAYSIYSILLLVLFITGKALAISLQLL